MLPIPEYVMDSPLTLRNEKLFLGLKVKDRIIPPEILNIPSQQGSLLQEYNAWKTMHGIGSPDVVKILAKIRLHWTPDILYQDVSLNNLMNDLPYESVLDDLLKGFTKFIFIPQRGANTITPCVPTLTLYDELYLKFKATIKDREVLILFTKFLVIDEAIKWANLSEESHTASPLYQNPEDHYGWSSNQDENIVGISQWLEIKDNKAFSILINVLTSSAGILLPDDESFQLMVFPKSLLLSERDLYFQRWLTLVITKVFFGTNLLRLPSPEVVAKLYKWGDQILEIIGNEGYDILKEIESFFVARAQHLLELDESTALSDLFWGYIRKTIKKDLRSYSLERCYTSLMDLVKDLNCGENLELSGLFRHWGHPLIEVEEGLLSIHENASVSLPVDNQLLNTLASMLSASLLRDFYFKHLKRWPSNTFVINPSSWEELTLQNYITNNEFPSEEQQMNLGTAWLRLSHSKLVDGLDEIPVSALIQDKRHAKDRDDITKILQGQRSYLKSASLSVIESYLETPHIDVLAFLRDVDKKGINKKYLIIVLKEKERELKRRGRFFSLMTFTLRLYFVSTEWLIEKYILPLFPEITMCKDQLEFTQQLLSSSERDQLQEGVTHHMISIDFEKWNNFQREESTRPVFEIIDKYFGYQNVISRTHEFFQNSTILYGGALHKIPPNLETSLPYCWNDHVGGFEGLRQKGWSVVGALLIRFISIHHRLKTRVLLQGDNQVIIIRYNMPKGLSNDEFLSSKSRHCRITKRFMESLSIACGSVGLRTKPEETWMSAHLLYYGKIAIIDGTVQSLFLKRVCRALFLTNEVAPSLTNSLGSMNTALLSGAYQIHDPLLCYTLYLLLGSLCVGYYMRYDPLIGSGLYQALQVLRRGDLIPYLSKPQLALFENTILLFDEITKLKTWNPSISLIQSRLLLDILIRDASLGGIGGAGFLRYMIRQFPDPVTESLTGAKILYNLVRSKYLKDILSDLGYPKLSKTCNYEILIQDPTSLNLVGSIKCTNILRAHVKELFVKHRTQVIANDSVREALAIEVNSKSTLLKFLMSIRPVFPRFLGELYSASPLALSESIVNKITNTRSAFRMTNRLGSVKHLRDKLFLNEVLIVLNVLVHWPNDHCKMWECSALRAQTLRDEGWHIPITGMTVPHPAEQWTITSYDRYNTCDCRGYIHPNNFLLLVPDNSMRNQPENIPWTQGSFTPYLGGHTKQKRIAQSEIELDTSSSILKSIIRLYNCSNWAFKDKSVLQRCIVRILSSYIPECELFLYNVIDITSGNLVHRFSNSRVSDGAVLGINPNLVSHTCISSNFLTTLGRGEDNYVIMFQAVFVYFQIYYGLRTFYKALEPYSIHIHPSCSGCFPLASEFELTATDSIALPPLSALLSNDLYEGSSHKPSIPESILRPKNPFAVSLNQVYLNPISISTSNNELIEYSLSDVEDSVYIGVSLCILCKIDFLPELRALTSYQLSVSLLRVLAWRRLKRSLVDLSLLFVLLHLRKSVLRMSNNLDTLWVIVKKYTIDQWSRVVNNSIGALLSNSGLDIAVFQEPVAHNASFPAKNAHIGNSGINSLIADLMELTGFPIWEKVVLPGDLNSGGVVSMISVALAVLSYLEKNTSLTDLERKLQVYEESLTILSRIKVSEFLTNKNQILSMLDEIVHPYIPVYFLRKDLKSLSTVLDYQPIHSIPFVKYLSPSREKVKSAIICWQVGWNLLKDQNDNLSQDRISDEVMSPLMHVFRPIWHSANGSVKIVSLLKVLNPSDLQYPVMIGDGNGGFSRVLNYDDRVCALWFNSLPEFEGLTDQQGAAGMPSAIASIPFTEIKVMNLKTCLEGINDILDPNWPESIRSQWRNANFKPTIIISDAEFYGINNMVKLIRNLYDLIPICPVNLVKMHLSGVVNLKFYFSSYLFSFMQILRSPYSNLGKQEVYVYIKWRAPHGDLFNEHIIPPDRALASDDNLFHFTSSSHFRVLDEYKYPVRNKEERLEVLKMGLSLRRNMARNLNIPLSFLVNLEGEIVNQKISPLAGCLRLLDTLYLNQHSFTLYIIENTDAYGSNKICRSRCVAWAATVVAASIFILGLLRDQASYQFCCSYYKYGCILHYQSTLKNLWLDNKMVPKGLFEFSYIELKPYIHETIRYLSSLWWASGVRFFKTNRSLEIISHKCKKRLSDIIKIQPSHKEKWTYIHPHTLGTFDTTDLTESDVITLDVGS